jgi:NADPH:quinone reductase-like Zn-dependent oxidoreductase
MLPKHYTRIVLAERPKTDFTPTTFLRETVAFDLKPGPGEVLVRVDWISLDPAMRGWAGWPMEVVTYIPPVEIGAVMRSFGLGAVVEVGEGCELRTGDIVCGLTGERLLGCTVLLPSNAADRFGGVCRYERGRKASKDHVSPTTVRSMDHSLNGCTKGA